jgi:hypothetical protein
LSAVSDPFQTVFESTSSNRNNTIRMADTEGKNGGDVVAGIPTTVLTANISNVGNLSDPVDVIIEKLIRYVVYTYG